MIEYYLGDTMDYEKWLDTEFDIIKNRVKKSISDDSSVNQVRIDLMLVLA